MWGVSYQGRRESILTETGQMEATNGGGITSPTDAIPDALVQLPPELTTSYAGKIKRSLSLGGTSSYL